MKRSPWHLEDRSERAVGAAFLVFVFFAFGGMAFMGLWTLYQHHGLAVTAGVVTVVATAFTVAWKLLTPP